MCPGWFNKTLQGLKGSEGVPVVKTEQPAQDRDKKYTNQSERVCREGKYTSFLQFFFIFLFYLLCFVFALFLSACTSMRRGRRIYMYIEDRGWRIVSRCVFLVLLPTELYITWTTVRERVRGCAGAPFNALAPVGVVVKV